jgi:hypothetical protein
MVSVGDDAAGEHGVEVFAELTADRRELSVVDLMQTYRR